MPLPPPSSDLKIKALQFDAVIIGGGVAGLWLLNRLVGEGYNAILLEQEALGAGQTIASQGMIHGGVKYTLAGALSGASEAIAEMPDVWRACLRGQGEVNLQQTKILSDHFYMWSTAGTLSKLTGFFASKALRGRVNELSKKDFPLVFANKQFKGNVYELVDTVIDTPSLLKNLADNMQGRIKKIDWQHSQFEKMPDQENKMHLKIADNFIIEAQQFIFSAGKGNEALIKKIDAEGPAMQVRPLQQVMVKHRNPNTMLYAHCMGVDSTPRITISSHPCSDGSVCWYLGGQLSEQGVGKESAKLIDEAKKELANLFPWFDWQQAEFSTYAVDRAEPKQKNLVRPDKAFFESVRKNNADLEHFCVAWPTKLTLVPHLAQACLQLLKSKKIQKGFGKSNAEALTLPEVSVAQSPWDITRRPA